MSRDCTRSASADTTPMRNSEEGDGSVDQVHDALQAAALERQGRHEHMAVDYATCDTMRAVMCVLAAGSASSVAKFWVKQCPTAASEAASMVASQMDTPKPAWSKTATRPSTWHIMTRRGARTSCGRGSW